MFKLCLQSILSKKLWSALIILVIVLSLTSTMSLLIASEAIKKELVEVSFNEYGGHAGVVSNIDDINTNSSLMLVSMGYWDL